MNIMLVLLVLKSMRLEITGPENSPYEGGIFELDLSITDRYPFEPPKTQIYHTHISSKY